MFKIIPLFTLQLLLIAPAFGQNAWEFRTEKEGIRIYTSEVPNSKIRAVKVDFNVKTTLSALVAVVMDIKACPEWLYHTKSCTIIKQVSPQEVYYYSEISLPWPAENRDFVDHLTVKQDPETKVVTINGPAIKGMVPLKKDIVRVADSKSKWMITPLANGELAVEYTLHVDPGGGLPAWLVNLFAAQGPLAITRSLQLQVQKPAYRNIALAYIKD